MGGWDRESQGPEGCGREGQCPGAGAQHLWLQELEEEQTWGWC